MKPKISIVLPVFQVEKYIENTVKSICFQTFKDFEVILVNDGTRDNSVSIAERILRKNKVQYTIINQLNKGVSRARNVGITNSKGEWIICIDSDDIINKFFLEKLYYSCITHQTDVAIANYQMVTKKNLFKAPPTHSESTIYKQKDILYLFLTRKINIITPAMLIKKDLITNRLFYDEEIKFSEDQHYIWKVLLEVGNFSYINTKLYNYYLRENSTMTSSNFKKILSGYNGFVKLTTSMNKEQIDPDLIMSRWVLGTLNSASKMLDYKDYEHLANEMNYKDYINSLMRFPDIKVKLETVLLKVNLKLVYKFAKFLK